MTFTRARGVWKALALLATAVVIATSASHLAPTADGTGGMGGASGSDQAPLPAPNNSDCAPRRSRRTRAKQPNAEPDAYHTLAKSRAYHAAAAIRAGKFNHIVKRDRVRFAQLAPVLIS